jgi:rod shape-determining protein MreC
VPARVVGKQPGSWFVDITLDKGSAQGVGKDMNVMTEAGLVGRVVEVGPNWCKVMTLLDRQSAVSAMIERTRDIGFVKGSGDPGSSDPKCGIVNLSFNTEVVPGDRVITSDFGGMFQKGVPVGTITEVSRDPNNPYALLTPAVDFSSIENVVIIKGGRDVTTEEEIAADESAMAAASATPAVGDTVTEPAAGSTDAGAVSASPSPTPSVASTEPSTGPTEGGEATDTAGEQP